ncbi:MAG: 50S ribosomal protein L22 [Zetaproteobacteria bacterium]|nr:MAG: 50S ribosomal protein L22 [Zetaproteobacteria bacterium]
MGKSKTPEITKVNEAQASVKHVRTSPQKLNLLARTIRGKSASRALIDLEFSKRRVAQDVRKLLQSAVANAENNHGLDVDRLIVAEAYVGKSIVMKRFRARARGRGARIEKKISKMTIIVREVEEV